MTPATVTSCLEALTDSARELSETALGGLEFWAAQGEDLAFAPSGHGAYLGIVADSEPIQVGILVDAAGCQLLAKSLLGMQPEDEDLPSADVGDAMCEIVNIVAGGLKRRVSGKLAVTMGLPIFVAGHPLPNQQQDVAARALKLGSVSVSVLVLTQKANAATISRTASSHKMQAISLPRNNA